MQAVPRCAFSPSRGSPRLRPSAIHYNIIVIILGSRHARPPTKRVVASSEQFRQVSVPVSVVRCAERGFVLEECASKRHRWCATLPWRTIECVDGDSRQTKVMIYAFMNYVVYNTGGNPLKFFGVG